MVEDMGICACPGCEHHINPERAAFAEGQAYCCTPCAAGHPDGMECVHPDCPCTELNRPSGEEVQEEPGDQQF